MLNTSDVPTTAIEESHTLAQYALLVAPVCALIVGGPPVVVCYLMLAVLMDWPGGGYVLRLLM
jgi:hypothetical protein